MLGKGSGSVLLFLDTYLRINYGVLFLIVSPQSSGGGEASSNVTEKKIRFASVVYSNPLGG